MDSNHLKDSHFHIFGAFTLALLSVIFESRVQSFDELVLGTLLVWGFALLSELLPRSWSPLMCLPAVALTAFFPYFLPPIVLSLWRLRSSRICTAVVLFTFVAISYSFPERIAYGIIGTFLAWIFFSAVNQYTVIRYDYELESDAKHVYSSLVHKLRENNRREVERSARESMLAERNRIARSLHDYIGHTISSAIMQLEAFRALYYPEAEAHMTAKNAQAEGKTKSLAQEKDAEALEHLQRIVSTLKSGMVDIRSSIHHLHDESLDLKERILELVERYPQIHFHIQVYEEDELPYGIKRELLQMATELVSNVAKYSDATAVRILLSKVGNYRTLQVRDNGSKKPEHIDKGLGFTSLEDFAQLHNGSVDYGYKNGFYVHLRFEMGGV